MLNVQHVVALHRVITAFPVSKMVWTALAIYYWKTLSLQGTPLHIAPHIPNSFTIQERDKRIQRNKSESSETKDENERS
jgi:hypothetical protein